MSQYQKLPVRTPVHHWEISCFPLYIIFSGIINARMVKYLEDLVWFEDEQGSVRRGRFCQDHISVEHPSFRLNWPAQHLSIFAGFVDMQKASDKVNKTLSFLKLLINKIDGNVYNAIKPLYSNTTVIIMSSNGFETLLSCNSRDIFFTWQFATH